MAAATQRSPITQPAGVAVGGLVTAKLDHRLELVLRKVFARVNSTQPGDVSISASHPHRLPPRPGYDLSAS
jgi:hypothetical protein